MQFEICHYTRYGYSVPVTLGPQTLRFLPRPDPRQQLREIVMEVEPRPVRVTEQSDPWGNRWQRAEFAGTTQRLVVDVRMRLETLPAPVCEPAPPAEPLLSDCLAPLDDAAALAAFAPQRRAGDDLGFLHTLNRRVHGFYHQGVRLEGPPRTPAQTIQGGEGVCRDLAVLFMAVCRQQGVPARFVSGYQQGRGTRERRYLHAWAEAWLPGRGWLGFDPTHGEPAGGTHVAVAAVCDPALATPIEGSFSFHGPQVSSTLDVDIRISTRP
jgi:transglutaminase-like putative cysteine protease